MFTDLTQEQSADCKLFKNVVQLVKSGFSNKKLISQTQNLLQNNTFTCIDHTEVVRLRDVLALPQDALSKQMSFVDDLVLMFVSNHDISMNVRTNFADVDQIFDTTDSLMCFARDVMQNSGKAVFAIPVRAVMLITGLC